MLREGHERKGFSQAERPRVWTAAGACFILGISSSGVVMIADLGPASSGIAGWMLVSILLLPFVGGRLLPYPHLGTALLVSGAFAIGFVLSLWLLATAIEPYQAEEAFSALYWTVVAPIGVPTLALPTYWISRWGRV